jgi:hypothetical protein
MIGRELTKSIWITWWRTSKRRICHLNNEIKKKKPPKKNPPPGHVPPERRHIMYLYLGMLVHIVLQTARLDQPSLRGAYETGLIPARPLDHSACTMPAFDFRFGQLRGWHLATLLLPTHVNMHRTHSVILHLQFTQVFLYAYRCLRRGVWKPCEAHDFPKAATGRKYGSQKSDSV